jgi:hypothetical protein
MKKGPSFQSVDVESDTFISEHARDTFLARCKPLLRASVFVLQGARMLLGAPQCDLNEV